MKKQSIEQFERYLTSCTQGGAPPELRGTVLARMQRELVASRWDRRLARIAAALLAVGVSMNLVLGLNDDAPNNAMLAGRPSQQALVRTAVAVARATDAETGSRFARQMAMMNGWTLSAEQSAAIEAAVAQQTLHSNL